jgi:hypothetical protein
VEATPSCIAQLPWDEAKKLCEEQMHWGRTDWELPDRASLVGLLRLPRHGGCTDFYSPGYHWTNEQGVALTFWGPTGYWGSTAGHFVDGVQKACSVRPVRRFN